MFRPNWKPLLIGAVVAVTLAMGAAQADACWRCGWTVPGCCGYTAYYTPSYTSCCTVGCDPCYSGGYGWYVGYRPGPVRRLLFGPYRWYYGYTGGWSDCCFDSCCTAGTVAPAAAGQGVPTEAEKPVLEGAPDAPAVPGPPANDAAEPPADSAPSTFNTPKNSGLLTIYVPYDAKITVNGLATRSEGSRRQYVSYGLKPGFQYKYVVRAQRVVRERENPTDPSSLFVERLVEEKQEVVLTAGTREVVTFGFNPGPREELASRQ